MGVGVFDSNFNETGGTFLVSGPLAGNDDYADYIKSIRVENPNIIIDEADDTDWNFRSSEDPMPIKNDPYWKVGSFATEDDALSAACEKHDINIMLYEEWARQQYDDFNESLLYIVTQAGQELGLNVDNRNGFSSSRASFDSEFSGLLSDPNKNMFAVGWRSWEHDFVIGVGASADETSRNYSWQDILSTPDTLASEIINAIGRSPKEFTEAYQKTIDAISLYIRISLMESKIECRFRTSGYTSGSYTLPDEAEIAGFKDALLKTVQQWHGHINLDRNHWLEKSSPEVRQEMLSAIESNIDCHEELKIHVPVFCHESGTVYWINALDSLVVGTSADTANLASIQQSAKKFSGYSIIPRNESTEDWFRTYQAKANSSYRNYGDSLTLIASAEEYFAATKNEFSFKHDSNSDDVIEFTQTKRTKMRM